MSGPSRERRTYDLRVISQTGSHKSHGEVVMQGCPTFWRLWATLEEEELSRATH